MTARELPRSPASASRPPLHNMGTTPSTHATPARNGTDSQSPSNRVQGLAGSPATVFDRRIVTNQRICTNCFRRIKAIQPAPPDDYWAEHALRTHNGWSGHHTLRHITTDITLGPVQDGEYAYPGADIDYSGDVISHGTNRGVVACGGCGSLNGRLADHREPRDMGAMIDATQRLEARYAEEGVPVCVDTLYETVRDLQQTSEYAGRDYVVFETATRDAVLAALDD